MGTNNSAADSAAVKSLQSGASTSGASSSPLTGSVGTGGDNHPADVQLVSDALASNNRLDDVTDQTSLDLESKIFTAQQDMGDLKVDVQIYFSSQNQVDNENTARPVQPLSPSAQGRQKAIGNSLNHHIPTSIRSLHQTLS